MYIAKKKVTKKCFTESVAYKTFFSSYSVTVDHPGEGSSESFRKELLIVTNV